MCQETNKLINSVWCDARYSWMDKARIKNSCGGGFLFSSDGVGAKKINLESQTT